MKGLYWDDFSFPNETNRSLCNPLHHFTKSVHELNEVNIVDDCVIQPQGEYGPLTF